MEPIKLDSILWETQAIKESVEAAGCTEAVGTHGTQRRVLDRSWKEKEEMTGENSWDLKRLKRCNEHMYCAGLVYLDSNRAMIRRPFSDIEEI